MAARLLAAGVWFLAAPPAALGEAPDFAAWKRLHGKQYASAAEELRRAAIYAANVRRYAARDAGEPLATFGPDRWSDQTPEEAHGPRHLLGEPAARAFPPPPLTPQPPPGPPPSTASVDWRYPAENPKGVNAVTPVKDQGKYGCCWAFGTTGALEGMTVIQQGLPLESLSEQELVDCCDECQYAGTWKSYGYLIDSTAGVDSTEASYPYKGDEPRQTCALKSGKTQSGSKIVAGRGSVGNFSSVGLGADGNQDAILSTLISVGPLNIGCDSNCLQGYKKGIITNCKAEASDHAVLIVGAGTDGGTPYFTVKNSWASDWGEGGYFRFQRNVAGLVSVGGSAHYPIAKGK